MPTTRLLAPALLLSSLLSGEVPVRAEAEAQDSSSPTAALTGVVTDVTRAVLRAVPVQVFEADGGEPTVETTTDGEGRFRVAVPAGAYRLRVETAAFLPFDEVVDVGADGRSVDIVLELEPVEVNVEVTPTDELIADTTMSLTSVTLAGDELLDLPRNEEDLATYLLLLAGADITGDLEEDILANFVIDGFEDGRLPSPDQIAQVIIDPESLSADGGGRPRIEIVTRPGTGRWRRSVDFGFADESLNARTPGEIRKEPRQTRDVQVEVEGPIVPDVLEMTVVFGRRADDRAGNSLRAITPLGDVFRGVVQPQLGREVQVEAELQVTPSHRLDLGFSLDTEEATNRGVGGFTLPERASGVESRDWRLQVSERLLREDSTNNLRLMVSHQHSAEAPVRAGFAIDVADAFRGGGGTARNRRTQLVIRLDDTLRLERGAWNIRWGGWLQYARRDTIDQDNFNGTFEFASLHDYCVATGDTEPGCAQTWQLVDAANARGIAPVYVDARGREVGITGVPVTFTQAFGNAALDFNELGFSTHLQGDRRVGRTASLRLGLRYEGTNHSRSFLRVNPMANFQYQIAEGTLLGVGAQLNLQDFGDYERLLRNDGLTHETELFISSPAFPDPFVDGGGVVGAETASLWRLSPDYRPPYTVSPQFNLTQQIPGNTRVTFSYSLGLGYRQRRTPNVNAPYPGTPLPAEILDLPRDERQEVIDQMRPMYPFVGNVTQIETTGRSRSSTMRVRIRPRGSFELFGLGLSGSFDYTYRRGDDDNDLNNPYAWEWGPSRRDHSFISRFRLAMPDAPGSAHPLLRALARATYAGTNFNFDLRASTGRLYSIRSGQDLNGDQSSRDRPAGVPRNTEVGPGSWNLDMTFTKDYQLQEGVEGGRGGGGRGGRGDFRRRLEGPRVRLRARVSNLLNHSQPRAYGSVVTSPLFGLPVGYTGGRTINLSMSVDF